MSVLDSICKIDSLDFLARASLLHYTNFLIFHGKYILKNNFNSFGKMSYMSESRTRLSPGWSWTENGGFGTVDYDLGQNIVQKFSKIFQKLKSCCLT